MSNFLVTQKIFSRDNDDRAARAQQSTRLEVNLT